MTSHHDPCFSTAALARERLERPGTKSEASRNGLGAAANAGANRRRDEAMDFGSNSFPASEESLTDQWDRLDR